MPQTTIKCTCGKSAFIMIPRRNGTAMAFMTQAYEMGWTIRDREWFCSNDCIANSAKDVTAIDKLLEHSKEPLDV